MLQRSPTYFIPGRNANELADTLRELEIDETWIHEIVRRKILHDQADVHPPLRSRSPSSCSEELLAGVARPPRTGLRRRDALHAELPAVAAAHRLRARRRPVQGHQPPARRRWSPTRSRRFTETGILLKSGEELEADIIVTATGFNLSVLGDIAFTIDGKPLDFADTVTYRGMMFTGVPNLVWVFGYFRASWTLRADLLGDFVCRLLDHMDEHGREAGDAGAAAARTRTCRSLPWIDPENFNPGYLMRGMHLLPKRGDKPEWQHTQDYWTREGRAPGHRPRRRGVRLRLSGVRRVPPPPPPRAARVPAAPGSAGTPGGRRPARASGSAA